MGQKHESTGAGDFEHRLRAAVRDAFDGELNGPLRYWRDDMLVDPGDDVRELGGRGVEVVTLGPDVATGDALALASAFDQSRPDISDVIVTPPSTDLLQEALRAGARDVIAPASAIDLLVHINRDRDGVRRVTRVSSIDGMEGDLVTLSDVFLFDGEVGTDGSVGGMLRPTGVRPKLTERLRDAGITLPAELFGDVAA